MTGRGRIDRRTAIKWILTAAAALPVLDSMAAAVPRPAGYGPYPDPTKVYAPGELWPLTLTPAQRRTVAALADVVIPADAISPSASQVGVPDFLDEWISAPYPAEDYPFARDRALILGGVAWLDREAGRRFGKPFADLADAAKTAICDDICREDTPDPRFGEPARFFARFHELAAGGFYTTPEGTKDLGYIGNVPLASFEGPPPEVLKQAGLA